ncbi:NmrA family NAD(P)-binding protein [Xylophilus rhododendri]|uniref:NmrA family NAD(P)-binding protein n=1 Tax=Xylophilus rhododendri TaxID=2697032 RepID=A0A857J6S3_9BURK|nr:NmrA/HSCARG family protein [Xylophilus rhododendri]QHI98488.1 NmrA family NAD(P)-binding protein [Xylophilus rhododendri]
MTILVTGSTGRIGSQLVSQLAQQGAEVRALTRDPAKARFPAGVSAVQGDLLDVASVRQALVGVKTLFLLVANAADELTQAINTLGLAREAGVQGIVYLSVTRADQYTDAAHFTSKHAVERMIEQLDLPATVLRPSYFMQNDLGQQQALQGAGLYLSPLGDIGVSMVDVRDIADAAALELLRRENTAGPLPRVTYEVSGPDAITGPSAAAIWSDALGRPVGHAGNDLDAFEKAASAWAPSWLAYDMRAMMNRYQQDGAVTTAADIERLQGLLGRPLRSYRAFVAEAVGQWQA